MSDVSLPRKVVEASLSSIVVSKLCHYRVKTLSFPCQNIVIVVSKHCIFVSKHCQNEISSLLQPCQNIVKSAVSKHCKFHFDNVLTWLKVLLLICTILAVIAVISVVWTPFPFEIVVDLLAVLYRRLRRLFSSSLVLIWLVHACGLPT